MAHRETLIAWLNDAYAMERALVPILENHAKDAKNHPEAQARIEEHVEQTRRHADLVKACVERLGSSTSAIKTGMGSLFGMLQSISTGAAGDEMVKNGLLDFGVENFEMACYRALVAAAEDYGDIEIARVCQEIMLEEQEMAGWLNQQLPLLVREHMRMMAGEHK